MGQGHGGCHRVVNYLLRGDGLGPDRGGELGRRDHAALLELDDGKGLEVWVGRVGVAIVGNVAADAVGGGFGLAGDGDVGVGAEGLIDGVEEVHCGRADDVAFAAVMDGVFAEGDGLDVELMVGGGGGGVVA